MSAGTGIGFHELCIASAAPIAVPGQQMRHKLRVAEKPMQANACR